MRVEDAIHAHGLLLVDVDEWEALCTCMHMYMAYVYKHMAYFLLM